MGQPTVGNLSARGEEIKNEEKKKIRKVETFRYTRSASALILFNQFMDFQLKCMMGFSSIDPFPTGSAIGLFRNLIQKIFVFFNYKKKMRF